MPPGFVGYVNVFVSDLERAIGFYGDVLGLKLSHAAREHGYASFDAGPISLGLAQVGDDTPDAAELVGRHTGIGLCVSDLEAAHAELRERGVRFPMPPERQPWGAFMAICADPDGSRRSTVQADPEPASRASSRASLAAATRSGAASPAWLRFSASSRSSSASAWTASSSLRSPSQRFA